MIHILNFVSVYVFYFTSLIMLYYYGTNIKQRIWNVAPGAFMATVLFFITLMGFQYYIKRFNYYDLLYGSVGLVMIKIGRASCREEGRYRWWTVLLKKN